jgi:precorrin-3B C17-methyltransferase
LFGYAPYLDRVPVRADQQRHASDNRQELERAEHALMAAAAGKSVAVVSGGDPGVFGMAAAVCEAIERGPPTWRDIDVVVIPGVSAMLAVAARAGAPLGHDFCALSLSDNLKPWTVIEQRLEAVATAGFVIALYNPISRARPWQLERAFAKLSGVLPGTTPVIFGRAVGRPDERMAIVPLSEASGQNADMATCIIVGSAETRMIARQGRDPLVYTPRGTARASAELAERPTA